MNCLDDEEERKHKKTIESNQMSDEYNKMFEEIMKKNKKNLIFRKDSDSNTGFKPLGQAGKTTGRSVESGSFEKSMQMTGGSGNAKSPIEFALYKDASLRKKKQDKIEYNNMMNILLLSSKSKISNNSHRIAINKVERMIDEVISENEKDGKVTFINLGEILTQLKIFRELFPKETPDSNEQKTFQNYREIQAELANVSKSEERKSKELCFFEQLWLTVNPGNQPSIKSEVASGILKILFAPMNSNVKDISEILRKFLLTAFFLNSNPEEVKVYISPITEKEIDQKEIWPIEKLVKEFLYLKENILAYQGIKHLNKAIQQDILRTHQELSFKPKIAESSKEWFKDINYQDYLSERLPALVEREKLRLQVLDEMKKESEDNELKECSFKPKINKVKEKDRKGFISDSSEVFNKLYTPNTEKYQKYQKIKEIKDKEKEEKELKACTFKPKLISQTSYKKSLQSTEKPKGYEEFSQKMREGILKAAEKRYKENKYIKFLIF